MIENSSKFQYFLVENKTNITNTQPSYLPIGYGCVGNIHYLEASNPEMLKNLEFAGTPDLGFWRAIYTEKPDYTIRQNIEEVLEIDPINCTVTVSYKIVKLATGILAARRLELWEKIRVIRDTYLKLTDFTQLADSPLTEIQRESYRTFRSELRNLVQADSTIDPNTIAWPIMPAGPINLPIFPAVPDYK